MDRADLLGNSGSWWKTKLTTTEAVVMGKARGGRVPKTWGGRDQSDEEGEGARVPTQGLAAGGTFKHHHEQ